MKLFRNIRSVESDKSADFPESLDRTKVDEYRDVVSAMDVIDEHENENSAEKLADTQKQTALLGLQQQQIQFDSSDRGYELRLAAMNQENVRFNQKLDSDKSARQLARDHELTKMRLDNERMAQERAASQAFELQTAAQQNELTLKIVAVVRAFCILAILVVIAWKLYKKGRPKSDVRTSLEITPIKAEQIHMAPIKAEVALKPAMLSPVTSHKITV